MTRPDGLEADRVVADTRCGSLGDGQLLEWWKTQGPIPGMTVRTSVPLPVPMPIDDVRAAVQDLARRHEALRTTFRLRPDGFPEQVVQPFDKGHMRTTELPDSSSRVEFYSSTWQDDTDNEQQWPFSTYLFVTDLGEVTEVIIVSSHTVTDGSCRGTLEADLLTIVQARRERRPHCLEPVRHQALDIVALDSSPEVQPERAATEEYWRRRLHETPSRVFDSTAHVEYQLSSGRLTAPAGPAVLAAAARRYRATPAVVYLSAVSMVLAALSGQRRIPLDTHYDSRNPDSATTVACLSRVIPVTVDLSDAPCLSQVVGRTRRETLQAQRNYRIAWTRFKELECAEVLRRGASFARGSTVNFQPSVPYQQAFLDARRFPDGEPDGPEPTWSITPAYLIPDSVGSDAYLTIEVTMRTLTVEAAFNSSVLAQHEMASLLTQPLAVVHRALRQGDVTFAEVCASVRARSRGPHVTSVGPCMVRLDQVAAVLARYPGVLAAHCEVAAVPDDRRLVAYVATHDAEIDPADLRSFVMQRAVPTAPIKCPDTFVICRPAPNGSYDAGTWPDLPRIAEATGLDRRVAEPADERERALLGAIEKVNAATVEDIGMTYLEAGGSLVLVPATLRSLRAFGLTGLHPDDFTRPVPLSVLAAGLVAVTGRERTQPPTVHSPSDGLAAGGGSRATMPHR
jgi:hypothetical protein